MRELKRIDFRHLPIVGFDNRLKPIPIPMKNMGNRPIPIPIPILYKALVLHTARFKSVIDIAQRLTILGKLTCTVQFRVLCCLY